MRMIDGLLWVLAALEVLLGVAVFASSNRSAYEVLGANLIGFAILTIGIAAILSEVRKSASEAAEERRAALQERQARAALDLKMRSGMISRRDREAALSEDSQHNVGHHGSDGVMFDAVNEELQKLRRAMGIAA